MERLGVKPVSEVFYGIKTGDNICAKLAGCVNSFQKRTSKKSGNKYGLLSLSDTTSAFEGFLFSEDLTHYEEVVQSGLPLLVSVVINKQNEESSPLVMIKRVETLDKAISEVANGLEISINDVSVVPQLHNILKSDRNGKNKIYIKPQNNDWDIRIELPGGFGLFGDILSNIRSLPGVTTIKEI